MQAAYLEHGNINFRDDLPMPEAGSGEVLLKVRLAAICGTDLAMLKGYADFVGVPGHEFVADVVALGDGVDGQWLGRRVAVEINRGCGQCEACRQNSYNHCLKRRVIGIRDHQGAFAEYIAVSAGSLHALPDHLSDRQAVFVEPLAAAFRIGEQLAHRDYRSVLIVGAGRLGQLIARVFALEGKAVSVVTRHTRQQQLLEDVPVTCVDEGALEAQDVDVVVEASGNVSGLMTALQAVHPMGVCVLKSSYHQSVNLDLSQLVINEIEMIGSRCGPFGPAIDALATGAIDPLPLIEKNFSLADVRQAFEYASVPGSMKVLLQP